MIKKATTFIIVCALALVLWTGIAGAQDVDKIKYPKLNEIKIPKVERVTFDNGMRVYLLEDKSLPLFNVNVRINCGSYLEPANKIGLAGICGDVIRTGGTAKWTGDEIDELLEGIGATVETNIGTTSGSAYVNVLSEYSDIGLEVLAEVLRRPVFDEDKIAVVKMQINSGIARRNDQIDDIGRREFAKLIYGADSPYARYPEYATINAITRDDLVKFHQAYFQPENIMLAVYGDFDSKVVLEKLKNLFGDWVTSGVPVGNPPRVNYEYRSKVYYIEKTDVEQAYIRMGHIGGLMTDPDYADRIVMNSILGEGFGSRITDAVRTRLGLAYSTGGRYTSNFSYPGYFFASASTKPGSAMLATREMIKQVKSMLTDLPTEKEMMKGKDGYLNSFVFNFDSRREVINRMMAYDFYGVPEDFLQQEKEGVERVTPEAVQAAAKKNLHPDEMVILIVGNAAQFEEPLENLGLGPVETIDITIPTAEVAQKVDASEVNLEKGMAILRKTVEFYGGAENFKKIKGYTTKGTITFKTPSDEFSMAYEAAYAFPNKRRNVIDQGGQFIYDVFDGEVGWKTGRTGELEPMTDQDIDEIDKELARNTIILFAQIDNPGYKAVYGGPDVLGDTPIEYVALTDSEGNSICRLGLAADGRLMCKSYSGQTPFGPGIIEEIYSNETEIEGVKFPMAYRQLMSGRDFGVVKYSEVNFNPEFSPDTFAKPQ